MSTSAPAVTGQSGGIASQRSQNCSDASDGDCGSRRTDNSCDSCPDGRAPHRIPIGKGISLPHAVRRELDRIAKEDGISRSDVLRPSLEDFLVVRWFRRLWQRMMATSHAQGIYTDEDVLTRALVTRLLDTQVLVAALVARGTCSDVLLHDVRQRVVISSPPWRNEVRDVLERTFHQRD